MPCTLDNPNGSGAWRCKFCGLVHYYCGNCKTRRTVLAQREANSIGELKLRADFAGKGWICDACWPELRWGQVPKATISPERY